MIPLLNFVAIVLLIFVTSYLFIEIYNIKVYLDSNENQLSNLVQDINYNNYILKQKIPELKETI
jgi:hypothetical protein